MIGSLQRVKDPEDIGCRRFGRLPSSNGHVNQREVCLGPECNAFLECLEEMLWHVDRKQRNPMKLEDSVFETDKEEINRKTSEIIGKIEYFSMQGIPKFADEDISVVAELKDAMVEDIAEGVLLFDNKGYPVAHNLLGMRFYKDICTCSKDLIDKDCPIHTYLKQIISGNLEETSHEIGKNERIYEIRFSEIPFGIFEAHGAVVTIRDVTNEKPKQRQILQNSKMAAIGEITSGLHMRLTTPLPLLSASLNSGSGRGSKI